jgi:hypothetical protein
MGPVIRVRAEVTSRVENAARDGVPDTGSAVGLKGRSAR